MSDRRARRTMAVLALAGLAIAGYLTWVHDAGVAPVCAAGGCERVQSSRYAVVAGVPVALLGVAAYAAVLASLVLPGDAGRMPAAVVALGGWMFSAYLTYVELFRIRAVCPWCVASALLMTALAILAAWRIARPPGRDAAP